MVHPYTSEIRPQIFNKIIMTTNKDTRYDRQLRLWAQDGQNKLEKARVCVIGWSPLTSEILKNLVLPGIGSFVIVLEKTVEEEDLSGNFFIETGDIGKPICYAMTKSLLELNPDVSGDGVFLSLLAAIATEGFFNDFNVVVTDNVAMDSAFEKLRLVLWEKRIPLFIANTAGLYGSLHVIAPETTIIDTHDPSKVYDLRIDSPWPELQHFVDSFDLDSLDDVDHAHVPYVVIFIKALLQWKEDHGGDVPTTYQQKKDFRFRYVDALARSVMMEANFAEASNSVHRALQRSGVPDHVTGLFSHVDITTMNTETPLFWILVLALKRFVSRFHVLPLRGSLPDMVSSTGNYVELMKLYAEKAAVDREEFSHEVSSILASLGRSDSISDAAISTFCKNAPFLHVSTGSYNLISEKLVSDILSGVPSPTAHYAMLALRSECSKFDQYLSSFCLLLGVSKHILPSHVMDIINEVFTHNEASYHNICALMGGVTAQEILKIATAQYIPLDNVFVFDGVKAGGERWKVAET